MTAPPSNIPARHRAVLVSERGAPEYVDLGPTEPAPEVLTRDGRAVGVCRVLGRGGGVQPPEDGMKPSPTAQRIAYPENPIMAGAWVAAVQHAAGHPGMLAAFKEATGRPFLLAAPRAPIERMVDEATGADVASINDFIDWFNLAVWGEDPFA